MRAAVSTVERTADTPARCPATRGMWRRLGPAPVAVHDDRDVFWEPSSIETPVDFGFLAVEPGGYFVLQSDPSNKRLTQGPSRWQ